MLCAVLGGDYRGEDADYKLPSATGQWVGMWHIEAVDTVMSGGELSCLGMIRVATQGVTSHTPNHCALRSAEREVSRCPRFILGGWVVLGMLYGSI